MNFKAMARLCAVGFMLCGGSAAVSAEDAATAGEGEQLLAPEVPSHPLPGTQTRAADTEKIPVPDPGTTGQAACIDETGEYATHGKVVTFIIGLQNKCDKRLKCKIFAYVVDAKGPSSGRTTMILGAKASGAAAKKTYVMPVKAAGGTATVSRECRVF